MRALNWTPTEEDVRTAKDVLAWSHREMLNAIMPELMQAKEAVRRGDDDVEERYEEASAEESGYNVAHALGERMITRAWKRASDRTKEYNYTIGLGADDIVAFGTKARVIGFAVSQGWIQPMRRIQGPKEDQEDLELAIQHLTDREFTIEREEA